MGTMSIDSAKRLAYELDRREHTAQFLIETNKKKPTRENPITDKAESMPAEGFQGA